MRDSQEMADSKGKEGSEREPKVIRENPLFQRAQKSSIFWRQRLVLRPLASLSCSWEYLEFYEKALLIQRYFEFKH